MQTPVNRCPATARGNELPLYHNHQYWMLKSPPVYLTLIIAREQDALMKLMAEMRSRDYARNSEIERPHLPLWGPPYQSQLNRQFR